MPKAGYRKRPKKWSVPTQWAWVPRHVPPDPKTDAFDMVVQWRRLRFERRWIEAREVFERLLALAERKG